MDTVGDIRPVSVVVHGASGRLAILWSDGLDSALGGEVLRAACKCAGCEQSRRAGHPPQPAPGVRLSAVEPYGESALHLSFDDGHDRGIYPWAYLHGLARAQTNLNTPP